MAIIDVLSNAPAANPERKVPAVTRLLSGKGANLIAFNFAPGQRLADHKAAHPITVQCLTGTLDFSVAEETIRLHPGMIIHLEKLVVHRVDCPNDAAENNILLLTMLTNE
ncbi:cupin domain-containing protein [Corynebacterium kutscheri]|nr:cupin domain-containing protein [Corynebacterium kutscheri]